MGQSSTRSIEQDYIQRHPGSQQRAERARQAISGGIAHDTRYMKPFPLYVDRANGSRKWDVDGNEFIDYVVGHGALILGHNHPGIVEALNEQINRGSHYGASHDLEVDWAERIRSLVPSLDAVRFTSSGTEATLMALRLARAFTGRDKILKFSGHFHGWHDYVVPGEKLPLGTESSPGIPKAISDTVVVAPVNDLEFVEQQLANGDIAAVILEPSGASWASIPFPDGFLHQLREITTRHSTVLIFDEVITGFRWSPGGKQQVEGIKPDMTTMAKIVAGGLPGGAVGGRADIMELLEFRDDPNWNATKKVGHPGTFNANPLSAVAGSACLQLASDPGVQRHADAMAAQLRKGMNQVLVQHDAPGFVWGESSVFHIVVGETCSNQSGDDIHSPQGVSNDVLKNGSSPRLAQILHLGMQLSGVDLFHGGGLLSSAHSAEDIDKTIAAFDTTISRMKEEGYFSGV